MTIASAAFFTLMLRDFFSTLLFNRRHVRSSLIQIIKNKALNPVTLGADIFASAVYDKNVTPKES